MCVPWAGAGAAPFRAWAPAFADGPVLYGVRLAGREGRNGDSLVEEVTTIVAELTEAVAALPEPRVALFGQCSGAIIAFELARSLRAASGTEPAHLLVAAQLAPVVVGARERALTREDLRDYLPPALRAEPELAELFLPILEADMRAVDRYRHHPAPRFSMPITVFHGSADPEVDAAGADRWREETAGPTTVHEMAGVGHLLEGAHWAALGAAVRAALG